MSASFTPAVSASTVTFGSISVDGLNIAYREAGDSSNPKLVLLHVWPASSHQFRELIPALATRFHILAPDYPGFGNSDTPDPAEFPYTFDKLAEVTEALLKAKGFESYGLYIHDYGGPVGFRLMTKHPEALEWLIIRNTNAYEVGFSAAWGGLRNALWLDRSKENEEGAAGLLALETVKATYLGGSTNPALISPDAWNMDFFHTLRRPYGRQLQLDLFYDYRNNVTLYPTWQDFLRNKQPKTIIFWGQGDIFFTPEGGEAYLKDLPRAEMHRLAAGHFATEDCLPYIAEHIRSFYETTVV